MSNERRLVNWPEIKARYLAEEKPAGIASEYYWVNEYGTHEDVTSKMIRQKAWREGWGREKEELKAEVLPVMKDQLAQASTILQKFIDAFEGEGNEDLYKPVLDKNRVPNKFHQIILTRLLDRLEQKEQEKQQTQKIEVVLVDPKSANQPTGAPPDDSDGPPPVQGS